MDKKAKNAECQRKYRAKIQANQAQHKEFLQKRRFKERARYQELKKNPEFMKQQLDRQKLHRFKKKNQPAMEQEGLEIGNFKARSSFSRALKKGKSSLPKESVNRQAVISRLFYEQFPDKRPKRINQTHPNEVNKLVEEFYNRDDVSQQLPGERDSVLIKQDDGSKVRVQKRVMLFNFSETYELFKKDYPAAEIKKTKFYLIKPKFISLVKEMKQIGCLCVKCENMKLIFTAMKPKLLDEVSTLEELMDSFCCGDECDGNSCEVCVGNSEIIYELFDIDDLKDEIPLSQWTKDLFQLQLKLEVKTLEDCINLFLTRYMDFKLHIFIKKAQSALFQKSISSSSEDNVVIQVDFAEKFKCAAQDEVQSAYFNQHSIAIFTVVAWAGEKKFSKVLVTDDTTQSKYCVVLFLHEIIMSLKEELPTLKTVNMFSDGCAGQFKNRWTLSTIVFAKDLFDVTLTWNFFAAGHGKGAVDGIGGTVKRVVRQRIMSRQARIYSAQDFHNCLVANITGIRSTHVSIEKIKQVEECLGKWEIVKKISGITKFFSFSKHAEKMIEAREWGTSTNMKTFRLVN